MISKKSLDVKIVLNKSYIKAIKNSVGSNLFRNLYAYVDGKKIDMTKDGSLSCSRFVSSILYLFKLCNDVHVTVDGAVKDMELAQWKKIEKPRPGAVLVWEEKETIDQDGDVYPHHRHIGFYIEKNKAISTPFKKGQPILHHWTYGIKNGQPVRKVEQIFWNKKLDK